MDKGEKIKNYFLKNKESIFVDYLLAKNKITKKGEEGIITVMPFLRERFIKEGLLDKKEALPSYIYRLLTEETKGWKSSKKNLRFKALYDTILKERKEQIDFSFKDYFDFIEYQKRKIEIINKVSKNICKALEKEEDNLMILTQSYPALVKAFNTIDVIVDKELNRVENTENVEDNVQTIMLLPKEKDTI